MFTVTDPGLIDTAVLLLQWPFTYALKPGNPEKFLAPHYANNPGLERAVGALVELLSSLPDLPGNESAWHEATVLSKRSSEHYPIRTKWHPSEATLFEGFTRVVDIPLYESVSTALHRKNSASKRVCDQNELCVLARSVWLSSHIALCVLGVARAELDGTGVRFKALTPASQLALRRAWFGVAFDQYSRIGDEAQLEIALTNPSLRLDSILHFFTKQWRLGLPTGVDGGPGGAIMALLDSVLIPSVKLLASCLQLSKMNRPLTLDQATQMACPQEFELIHQHMESLPVSERAMQPGQEELFMGPLQLIPALLSVAERIAREKIGDGWHAALGHEMAKYLASRTGSIPGVRVMEVELRQEMTSEGVPLDVDLFIVDERINRVYAIQCKHFESSFRIDLLDWLVRFRRPRDDKRTGLDKALQQLENLPRLCRDDERIRSALVNDVGLTEAQIDTIRPIVIHNLGNLDFWQTDQGVCIYDLHTFCSAVKGREATVISISSAGVNQRGTICSEAFVDMADPDSVLSAYINDPASTWQDLAHFDAMSRAQRVTTAGSILIVADGLGI